MGADHFIAYAGIRFVIDPGNEAELEALEGRKDPRQVAAREAGLKTHWGRWTDGEYCFLLIGTELGGLGVEGMDYLGLQGPELAVILSQTKEKLLKVGFTQDPALHLQFSAQH